MNTARTRNTKNKGQKYRPAVTQLPGPVAELMARIGHGERLGIFGQPIAGENFNALR